MAREWTLNYGLPGYDFLEILENGLATQAILNESPTEVTVGDDTYQVILTGNFVYGDGTPGPESGVITGIEVYAGAALVGEATGYNIDVDDFGDAFDDLGGGDFSAFMDLFFLSAGPRVIINGSDDTEHLSFITGGAEYTLRGNGGNDSLIGGLHDDEIFGGAGKDVVYANDGDDYVVGGNGSDTLLGGLGQDELRGGKGHDKLHGQVDDDVLFGGKGNDQFIFFDVVLGPGGAGVDTIMDLKPGQDVIKLDSDIFVGIGSKLNASEFHAGSNAQDADDHIIYKKKSGALFYDSDGDGAANKVKFAILDNKPDLSHTDFIMI